MSRSASKAMLFIILMISASITPLVGNVAASDTIVLSLDTPHVVLQGGDSTDITLTVKNNGSSIEHYNVTLDTDGLSNAWSINLVSNQTSEVIPTQSTTVDIVLVLAIDALPSDSGSFVINVSEQDGDLYSTTTAYVTVEPSYASSLSFNAINGPFQQMLAGTSANYTIDVNNDGNAPDTILLDVDAEPDLATFWANHDNNTNNQNPSSIQNSATHPGWNLVFADHELANIPAGSTVQTTIQVAIPSDAAPGFYGFNLFSASTKGNTSSSYTFAIEVMPENNLSFSFLSQDSDFIPGQITPTYVQVTNTGNAELDLNWELAVHSGPCVVQLIDASTESLQPTSSANIGFTVDVGSSASMADECIIDIDGEGMHGDYLWESETYQFTIAIDELVDFELFSPTAGSIQLVPSNPEDYQIRIYNNGSELVEFFLDIADNSPISSSIIGNSSVNVSSGGVGVWMLSTDILEGFVGAYSQDFTVNYAGISTAASVQFDVQPVADFIMTGPLDGRISTKPGEMVDVNLQLDNLGTMDLDLTASVSGLPTGAEVTFSNTEVDLDAGTTFSVTMSVSMISTAQSGSYSITVTYSSEEFSRSLNLELQVADSVGLTVNSINNNIAAGPISQVVYTFEVTNLGSATDTFFVALDFDETNNATTWFDTTLSTSSINLDSSSTQAVTISIRERAAGAPTTGCDVSIIVTSSNDDTVASNIGFKILPIQASAQIKVLSGDDSAKPGETISGDIVVTNSGTGEDQFTLTTVGEDCGLSEIFLLAAGSSSQAYSWICTIDEDASAGLSSFKFRVTSNARSNYVLEQTEIFTVEPNWDNDNIIEVSFGDESLSMASSGGSSTLITVKNLANAPVNGDMLVLGSDDALFEHTIYPVNSDTESSEFYLAAGQSTVFELVLTSRVSESEAALLTISAGAEIGGITYPHESSNELAITIDGPELPPNGVELPYGLVLDQQQTIYTMVGGWIFSLVLLVLINTLRKRRRAVPIDATVEEVPREEQSRPESKPKKKEEKTVQVHKLKSNECRMTPDNKVICPFCEAKLGVPRGSTPPFKFSCPQCAKKIRVVENQKF